MKKKILYFSLFLFSLIFILFLLLKNGISISSVQFDFLKLDKLYIKLDKKLILQAKNISFLQNYNSSKSKTIINAKQILSTAKQLKFLYNFVEEIDIQNLTFKDKTMKILFKDDNYFIDSNDIFLKVSFVIVNDDLVGSIKSLVLKNYNLNLNGKFKINTKSNFYNLNIYANNDNISFESILSYKDNKLLYKINDVNVSNIQNIANDIRKNFTLNKCIDNWVFKRATGEFYHLDYLQGFIDFEKNDYYLNNIKSKGYVKNVKIILEDGIKAIKIPMLNVDFSNQKLNFDFDKASYLDYDLSKSKVFLFDLLDSNKAGIFINVVSDFLKLDQEVQKILRLYNINIPVVQNKGSIDANLVIKFVFDKIDKDIFYEGDFNISNSVLNIANFNIEKAHLKLKNNKAIISNASSNNDFLKSNFIADIDLKKKYGIFDINITKFYIPAGLLDIENQNIKIEFDYKDKANAFLPNYNIKFDFDEGLRINFLDFSLLKPYSKILKKINFKNADSIYFFTKDFIDFEMAFKNVKFDANFYKLNNDKYNQDSFFIIKNKNTLQISSASDFVNFLKKDNKITANLNSLSLEYDFKDENKIDFSNINNNEIILNAKDIKIILKDLNKTLDFDTLQAFINKDTISAKAHTNFANFELLNTLNKFNVTINNAKEQNINTFFQKNVVENGDFNMSIIGENVKNFKGKIEFKNTFIKDLKSYNQLISFIDTIPSLLLFKSPTFNEKGLSVKNGAIIFARKDDNLQIKALKINGDSVDIYGLGDINLKNDTIDVDIQLNTLKSASKVISNIPIISHIFLGDKKQISTSLKISGDINNAKIQTQVFKDTIKTPFNLIKNIFTLPLNLVN